MQTKRAAADDWPAVRDLLTEAGLPLDGAAEAFATGVVASDGDRLVGCAAIEPYDGAALLRSVAVVPDQRGTGVGTSLVHALEDLARDGGATSLILLDRDGRAVVQPPRLRDHRSHLVPADVAGSVEFVTACSTTAVAMRRTLA